MTKYLESAQIRSYKEFKKYVREDWKANNYNHLRPGSQAMIMYRFGVWQNGMEKSVFKKLCGGFYELMHFFCRNFYGIEIHKTAKIGRRLMVSHQSGIVLHPDVVVGDDCSIRQGVTIGRVDGKGLESRARPPTIGNRVRIGAGAIILGGISVGDDSVIGPNTVVTMNIPEGAVVTCPQPRVFSRPPRPEKPKTEG